MAEVWADGCRRHHKFEPLRLTGKTAGQFKLLIAAFHHVGVHPLEALGLIVKHWLLLDDAPRYPNVDFLTKHREEAVNLVLDQIKEEARDAERRTRQAEEAAVRSARLEPEGRAKPKKPATYDDLLLWKDKAALWELYPDLKKLLFEAMDKMESGFVKFTGQESLDEVRGMLADKAKPTNPEPSAPLPAPVWKKPMIEEEVALPEPDKVVPLFPQKAA